jgi:hypothetical protein
MGGPAKPIFFYQHLINNKMGKVSQYRSLSGFYNSLRVKTMRIAVTILLMAFVSGISMQAQDIIKLKSGKEMKVNIIDEGTDIIKYREFDNPDGPVYSVKRDQVESVKYKKGNRDTIASQGNSISNEQLIKTDTGRFLTVKKRYILLNGAIQSPRKVKTIMEDNPEASALYESGRKKCNASNTCALGVMVVSLTTSIISNGKSDQDGSRQILAIGLGLDGGLIIAGIILASSGKHNIKRSVELFNSSLRKPVSYKLDFGIQDNGIGFGLRF